MKIMSLAYLFFHMSFAVAAPDCDYSVNYGQVTAQVLETKQTLQQSITLTRGQHSPYGICGNYQFYFGKGSAQSYQRHAVSANGHVVKYNLHQNINLNGVLKEQPDALNPQEYVSLNAPDRFVNYHAPFYFSLPDLITQNYPPKGIYNDNVQVVIWTNNEPGFVFDKATNLAVTIVVPTRLDISLVDVGGGFDASSTSKVFDFGNITENQEKSGDLRVLSNTPYELKMTSQNSGLLKKGSSSINYMLTVNNIPVSLTGSAPVSFASGTGTSGINGESFNVRVKIIENTSGKPSGLYQDVITITAIAN
jgi:spore coat protein U-like protein